MLSNLLDQITSVDKRWLGWLTALAALYIGFWTLIIKLPESAGQCLCLLLILLPALVFTVISSRFTLYYVMIVWVFYPEVRRIYDWSQGEFTHNPLLSLAPLICSMLLLVPILLRPMTLPVRLKNAFICFGIAFLYAVIIGVLRNGIAALYDPANYIAPFMVMLYTLTCFSTSKEKEQWLRFLVLIALIEAVYGMIQWVLLPPWDAFWIVSVNMQSAGKAVPFGFRIFSTLNSSVPYAWLMATALCITLADKRLRRHLGWPAVAILIFAVIWSQVRTTYLFVLIALFYYFVQSKGMVRRKTLMIAIPVLLVIAFALPRLPGSEKILQRLESSSLQGQRSSLSMRLNTSTEFLNRLASNPLGSGFGSISVATYKFSTSVQDVYTDTGVLQLLLVFGPLGFVLLCIGFWQLFTHLKEQEAKLPERMHLTRLARAILISSLIALISWNGLLGFGGLILWSVISAALPGRQQSQLQSIHGEELTKTADNEPKNKLTPGSQRRSRSGFRPA